MKEGASAQRNASPLDTIAKAVDVALHNPQPQVRMEARAYLRNVDFELVLLAATTRFS